MELSEQQSMLRDSVERYVREHLGPLQRMQRLQTGRRFNPATWQTFAELGLFAAPFPESLGGLGGGAVDVAVVMQAFGNALVLEPYLAGVVFAGAAIARADGARRTALMAGLIDGTAIPALACFEAAGRFNPGFCATRAEIDGSGWRLYGHKSVVPGGGVANHFIISARIAGRDADPSGISLFVAERGRPGLTCVDQVTLDDRCVCDLRMEGLQVDVSHLLGTVGGGHAVIDAAFDHAVAASLSEAVGSMDAAMALTLEHLKTRHQFGRPLATNQALQHRLVDMHIAIEEARVMAWQAARLLDESESLTISSASSFISAAKVLVADAVRRVGQESIQLHGAIGTTHEAQISHLFKRLTAMRFEFGDADFHAQRYMERAAAARAPSPMEASCTAQ